MSETTDRPKKSALLTLADMREILAYFDAHVFDSRQLAALTLEQLIEIKFAARGHANFTLWLNNDSSAAAEFERIIKGEPHRRGLKLKVMQDTDAEDPRKSFDDPSPEVIEAYCEGDVWGFVLENEDGDHLGSCWGFYGDDKEGIAWNLDDDAKTLLDAAWEARK